MLTSLEMHLMSSSPSKVWKKMWTHRIALKITTKRYLKIHSQVNPHAEPTNSSSACWAGVWRDVFCCQLLCTLSFLRTTYPTKRDIWVQTRQSLNREREQTKHSPQLRSEIPWQPDETKDSESDILWDGAIRSQRSIWSEACDRWTDDRISGYHLMAWQAFERARRPQFQGQWTEIRINH